MMYSERRTFAPSFIPSGSGISWEQGPSDQHRLRRDQLLFRRLEVYLTYTHFRNLIESTLSTSFREYIYPLQLYCTSVDSLQNRLREEVCCIR